MLAAGTTLGPYKILAPLGAGGMGEVYLAEDPKHHREVAIKVLTPEIAAAVGSERFLREIEIAAKLTHPHILPVHDSGSADGLLYYVMPFVEGESLRQRLQREKQLPVEDALRIAREVADALSYAHSRGVIHRDIKPENVLLEEGHAVVADFGIARAVAAASGEALTRTGIVVGTPAYMSPEQAAGRGDLDGRSDLYSLGCVLYEMLAGVPPFSGATAESLAHQHLSVSPRPVTELRPAVPAGVALALQRALAKTPADRFNPVALFGEALGTTAAGAVATTARPRRRLVNVLAALGAAAVVVAVVATLWMTRGRRESPQAPAHGRTDIAVLPFQNLSGEGPNAYFAGGLHEELLTQLAKVATLKVISRTSVMGYSNTTKPLKQIASELGVGSLVEGSVQVAGNRLRVNVQLIDAATDEHLWAERYDRTLDDAFAIQSEVAQQIVAAVGAALASGEREAIAEAPTKSPEAYRLYLQGEEYRRRPMALRENLESAQQLYERALALDPGFALAHAALSVVHGTMLWFRYDSSPERAAAQRKEAEAALRLAPHLPQAHLALGLAHYWGRRDFRRALEELQVALRAMPNDAALWWRFGLVQRRLGNWVAVDSAYRRTIQLDPRNADVYEDLGGNTNLAVRRYSDAVREFNRALALAPDHRYARIYKGYCYVLWKGDLDTLQAAVQALPRDGDLGAGKSVVGWLARLLLYERKADSLLVIVHNAHGGEYEAETLFQPALYAAWAHRLRGDERAAQRAFAEVLRALATVSDAEPNGWIVHAVRGLALAGLGRKADALDEARWLRESRVYREDRFADGPNTAEARAAIFVQVGEVDAALSEIERLLAGPSWLSVHTLRLDPRWDPIREHPRFRALLVKYANPERVAY